MPNIPKQVGIIYSVIFHLTLSENVYDLSLMLIVKYRVSV